MADIIVCETLHISQPHRQHGLGAIQCLNLAFFVHTQHQGIVGRIQIQPHDIPHLLHKEGVSGELEMLLTVRLNPKGLPDALDRRF